MGYAHGLRYKCKSDTNLDLLDKNNLNQPVEEERENDHSAIDAARALLQGRFHGTLATQSTEYPGYPFGSVVPFSLDEAGWPLILVSHLARHTRHLEEDPRCSLVLLEEGDGDVQQLMRLTVLADAQPVSPQDTTPAERHFRYFPGARDYYEALNFRFYRILPVRFHFVGGFGSARWIDTERLRDRLRFSAQEESRLLELINGELHHHLHRVYRTAFLREQTPENPIVAVGVDRRGLDLRHDTHLCRRGFPEPVASREQLFEAIARL